jgi:hypothetical protein
MGLLYLTLNRYKFRSNVKRGGCSYCIITIITTISFMQGIYTYIPEKNNVRKEYNVAAILSLLFMVPISLVPV